MSATPVHEQFWEKRLKGYLYGTGQNKFISSMFLTQIVSRCRRIFRNQDKSELVPKNPRIFRNHSHLSCTWRQDIWEPPVYFGTTVIPVWYAVSHTSQSKETDKWIKLNIFIGNFQTHNHYIIEMLHEHIEPEKKMTQSLAALYVYIWHTGFALIQLFPDMIWDIKNNTPVM